ncbi:MAG: lipocalin-like domain-containing protein [Gammaproteobacteria bacterium]|jgi:predicted secreted hydrolase
MIEWRAMAAALALGACLTLSGCESAVETESTSAQPGLSGIRYLAAGDDASGFARATEPRDYFVFPADHSDHPAFRTEWWYFTGNVFDAERNHYGFELTAFRIGVNAARPERESQLAAAEVWMAHLAVTDTSRQSFQVAERLSRGAPGIAGVVRPGGGADAQVVIQVEDFSATFAGDTVSLSARDRGFGIELELSGLSRIVPQGDNGLDRKGPESGNASYYFSAPRLTVRGDLASGDAGAVAVEGSAWMDREWSTSALSPDLAGWDWFALQLDDGRDLMFYRLRSRDGGTSEFSSGSITAARGSVTRLEWQSVELVPTRSWASPATGVRYPVEWRLRVPDAGLDLSIEPRIDDQEIDESVRYWEGAVSVTGTAGAAPIEGVGYLELAGY